MLTPRSSNGWIALIVAVLIASTIVTAALAAVLTQVLFPNGFLIDTPAADPPVAIHTPAEEMPRETASSFGWRASVSCTISLGDVKEAEGRGSARP